VIALERKKEKQKAHGEIETEHPGYLGPQETYYFGTIKGVGRIYQQTFIDTYNRVALQADLDEWLDYYKNERPHSGWYYFGKTRL